MTTDQWNVLGNIGSLLAGLSLLVFVGQAFFNRRSAKAAIFQNIFQLSDSILRNWAAHPEEYDLIFDRYPKGRPFVEKVDSQTENTKKYIIAIRWLEFADLVLALQKDLPRTYQRPWHLFIEDCLSRSDLMRCILKDNKSIYPELYSIAGRVENMCREIR